MEQLDNHIQSNEETSNLSFDNSTSETSENYAPTENVDSSSNFTTPVEDYDVIRYNKQEVKIPVSERQTYLQKGYNYDKVNTQLQEAQKQAQYLDRLASMQGFNNTQEFLTALEQYEQEQHIQREAETLGVDERVIREHLNPLKSELDQIKKQNEELRRYELQRVIEADVSRMREKYSDFNQYENDIYDLASRGLDLEQAYRLASYDNSSKRIEQEVMARIRERDGKQVLSSADRGSQQKIRPQDMSLDEIEALSLRVSRGEKISF
ncbi:hypothetical protein UFOVP103_4 [uncultured Caudovirales phage]|uniref:Uncharacterized protein n=1 Tax=uncultured Caudovirales phage TaxID=2100421 RepID=A0A6J7WI95_9CAUD|nr:hypothetical protein UFOVP103_4 [uncultured Caudovirales phage]CAB5216859.1 hypothetical protein UFOVP197_5 [uncultured Caudovirales phage]